MRWRLLRFLPAAVLVVIALTLFACGMRDFCRVLRFFLLFSCTLLWLGEDRIVHRESVKKYLNELSLAWTITQRRRGRRGVSVGGIRGASKALAEQRQILHCLHNPIHFIEIHMRDTKA